MSMFGEIKFFVGLQMHQMKNGIYINQSKYVKEILKYFGMEESKPWHYGAPSLLLRVGKC